MPYALEAIGLTKIFRHGRGLIDLFRRPTAETKEVTALDGVSLQVNKGEIFALLGPNGAGKTTLIKVFCYLVIPDSGRCAVNGLDVSSQWGKARSYVSLIYGEEKSFYWRLTLRENLEFFAALYNLGGRARRKKINELAELLGIKDLDVRYQECSAGIRQRAAVARSLLGKAEILFMDEPFQSLDPLATASLRDFTKNVLVKKEGKTVFFVTHRMEELEGFADRIGIINKGRLLAVGSLNEVKEKFGVAKLGEIFARL